MSAPAANQFNPLALPHGDDRAAERALLLGGTHGSGVLELAMDRLRELESLLRAYEAGRILVAEGVRTRRHPDDPVRELRGRIAAAKDFIANRLPDIATHR